MLTSVPTPPHLSSVSTETLPDTIQKYLLRRNGLISEAQKSAQSLIKALAQICFKDTEDSVHFKHHVQLTDKLTCVHLLTFLENVMLNGPIEKVFLKKVFWSYQVFLHYIPEAWAFL